MRFSVRVVPVICFTKNPNMPLMSSPRVTGSVASRHAFLGCAYVERFHNQKIKSYFRESVYAETRERIVINWVLNNVRALALACAVLVEWSVTRFCACRQPRATQALSWKQSTGALMEFCRVFLTCSSVTPTQRRTCTRLAAERKPPSLTQLCVEFIFTSDSSEPSPFLTGSCCN